VPVIVGQKLGFLTIIELPYGGLTKEKAVVRCDCGKEKTVAIHNMLTQRTVSCGCFQKRRSRELHMSNLHGRRFGRLVALSPTKRRARDGAIFWAVRCDCGAEKEVGSSNLTSGNTQSCGCLMREKARRGCLPGDAARHYYLDKYQRDASRRGFSWGLSDDQFYALISGLCYYCGVKPTLNSKDKDGVLLSNGVDRKDNGLGYSPENCVPCCKFCQYAKRDLPYAEFLDHLERASKFKIWEKTALK
jgi:hypothetical protein